MNRRRDLLQSLATLLRFEKTGADIDKVVNDAGFEALRDYKEAEEVVVEQDHFEEAIKKLESEDEQEISKTFE